MSLLKYSRTCTLILISGTTTFYLSTMPDDKHQSGSVKSSEYSGTAQSVKEYVTIDPKKASQVVSSGEHTKRDRAARKKAREEKNK